MESLISALSPFSLSRSLMRGVAFAVLVSICAGGCQKAAYSGDPQLKPIAEMLEAQLPAGTSEAQVTNFLESRGYRIQPAQRPGTIVALIPPGEAQPVQPVAARVTFYFDANRKLNTFELQRTSGEPKPQ